MAGQGVRSLPWFAHLMGGIDPGFWQASRLGRRFLFGAGQVRRQVVAQVRVRVAQIAKFLAGQGVESLPQLMDQICGVDPGFC